MDKNKEIISVKSLNKVFLLMCGISLIYFLNVVLCLTTGQFYVTRGILFLIYVVIAFAYIILLVRDFKEVERKDLMRFNIFFFSILFIDIMMNGLLSGVWSLSIYSYFTSPILIAITFIAMTRKLKNFFR